MKKFIIITILVGIGTNLSAQNEIIERNNTEIRSILKDWDPIRGEWLSSSLLSMSNNEPAPTRTFPERLTAFQLFTFVPHVKRDSVTQLLRVNDSLRNEMNPDIAMIGLDYARLILSSSRRGNSLSSFTFGDPHIVDFYNNYIFQSSQGEFVMAKSKTSSFEVQARFENIDNITSFTTAVSMNIGGDIVSFYANEKPDNLDYTVLRVNNQPTIVGSSALMLPMGGILSYENRQYTIYAPNGESVIVIFKDFKNKKYVNVAIEVPSNEDSNYEGLTIGTPDSLRQSNNNNYRVSHDASIFEYTDEKDFRYYSNLNSTVKRLPELSKQNQQNAEQLCKNMGVSDSEMEGCVYDYGNFGIIPSPRPRFSHPEEEISLSELNGASSFASETPQQIQDISEPMETKEENRIFPDINSRQQLTRAILTIIMEASASSGRGRIPVGR